ncbi:MAG: fumarylacetoacetate hydrolase family protein, partial [Pseudomonadota bacterium]|nr:fumarylacetoacetate hydrolase family protein [Pseudomonadota bacterium]
MKLVSFEQGGTPGFGIATDGGIIDLTGKIDGIGDMAQLIAADALGQARALAETAPTLAFDQVTLMAPVRAPEKIWCIGVNYGNRNAEYKDGSDLPKYPSLFVRSASSFVGHDVPLERPTVSEKLDYEGEITIVIGKGGR